MYLVCDRFQVFQNKPSDCLMVSVLDTLPPPGTQTQGPGASLSQGGNSPECGETADLLHILLHQPSDTVLLGRWQVSLSHCTKCDNMAILSLCKHFITSNVCFNSWLSWNMLMNGHEQCIVTSSGNYYFQEIAKAMKWRLERVISIRFLKVTAKGICNLQSPPCKDN